MPSNTANYNFNLPLVNDPIDADLWGGQLNANWTSIDSLLKTASDKAAAAVDYVDVGDLKVTARSTAPSKWLLCQGQAISRATYSDLFTAIGTTYGAGDGSTTFNVPDTGGRVVAGKEAVATRLTSGVSGVDGGTLGAAGGDQNMHQHTHTITDGGHTHTAPTVKGQVSPAGSQDVVCINGNSVTGSISTSSSTTGITAANAGTGSSQNVQPTIVLNWLIYAGV
jgi:microcystin-dependent protein